MKSASLEVNGLRAYLSTNESLLHVPIAALLDFCGFRMLAMGLLPVSKTSIVYGSSDQARTVHTSDSLLNDVMLRCVAAVRDTAVTSAQ